MTIIAGAIVREGKAYIPSQGQIEDGPYVDIDPVYTV